MERFRYNNEYLNTVYDLMRDPAVQSMSWLPHARRTGRQSASCQRGRGRASPLGTRPSSSARAQSLSIMPTTTASGVGQRPSEQVALLTGQEQIQELYYQDTAVTVSRDHLGCGLSCPCCYS
mgnify:CR=1 FL=1